MKLAVGFNAVGFNPSSNDPFSNKFKQKETQQHGRTRYSKVV